METEKKTFANKIVIRATEIRRMEIHLKAKKIYMRLALHAQKN